MNNPFHRAAMKAFMDSVAAFVGKHGCGDASVAEMAELVFDFERRLESQARAFDACKSGSKISMTTLAAEQSKALMLFYRRLKLDGNLLAAQRAFEDHMRPHFEVRLW